MPDINQVKQDVVNIAKSAEAQVSGAISTADVEAAKLKAAAVTKLNQEETWIEKNPRKVTFIVVALLAVIIAMLAKGYAG